MWISAESIQRIPTVDEVVQELSHSKDFGRIDLKKGYHQIELEEDSRIINTFVSHVGLFRYKRLMFGISSAPEAYQHIMQQDYQHICLAYRIVSV